MAKLDEIAPDLYRICIYVSDFDMQFNLAGLFKEALGSPTEDS